MEGIKTNKYIGTRNLKLRYKKNSWNREPEYVNSFFASIFTVEEFHELANLKSPSGANTGEIIQTEVSKSSRDKSTKGIAANCQEPMLII